MSDVANTQHNFNTKPNGIQTNCYNLGFFFLFFCKSTKHLFWKSNIKKLWTHTQQSQGVFWMYTQSTIWLNQRNIHWNHLGFKIMCAWQWTKQTWKREKKQKISWGCGDSTLLSKQRKVKLNGRNGCLNKLGSIKGLKIGRRVTPVISIKVG